MAIDFQYGEAQSNIFNKSVINGFSLNEQQLASFNNTIWNKDLLFQLKTLFNDPIDSICSLHIVPFVNTAGAVENTQLKIGNLDIPNCTGARLATSYSVLTLTDDVTISTHYNNFLDYAPYTKVKLFLPLIGMCDLDTNIVMGKKLSIVYILDNLTGGLTVQVKVGSNVLYTYSGSCIIRIPITSVSYAAVVKDVTDFVTMGTGALVGALAGDGKAVANSLSGLTPARVISAIDNITNPDVNIKYNIGGSTSIYACRKVFAVISRPVTQKPTSYDNTVGLPSQKTAVLSNPNLTGFVSVSDIHLQNTTATEGEQDEIVRILKDGIII